MSKPIDVILANKILKVICFFKSHAWLSKSWNVRACNRCGKKQVKEAMTGYRWVDVECVIKPFNPCD
jgi:hypothetical protein